MVLQERQQSLDCEPADKKELQTIKEAVSNFVKDSKSFKDGSGKYLEERGKMVQVITSVDKDCMKHLRGTPKRGDIWERTLLDVALDDTIYDLSKNYPNHPHVVNWISGRSFWKEFVVQKQKSEDLPLAS